MAMRRKEHSTRTFNLRQDLADRMDSYSDDTGIPKTVIIEKALEAYLNEKAPMGRMPSMQQQHQAFSPSFAMDIGKPVEFDSRMY